MIQLLSTEQAPAAVVMVRPHAFSTNPMTMRDNAFQRSSNAGSAQIARAAYEEVGAAAVALEAAGVRVHLFEDTDPSRPDSVFPNNWFSTHAGGHVALYPIYVPNRRLERRADIIEMLKARYRVQDVVDFSGLEQDGLFLESTGAMVFDHLDNTVYVSVSNRADPVALQRFTARFGYEPVVFDAVDRHGRAVYHTNVMMTVATDYALICLSMITSPLTRDRVARRLSERGREVVELTHEQVSSFAGNAIELSTPSGRILAMSRTGYDSLTSAQKRVIERSTPVLALDVPHIELAGGSVRCMLAGLHLDARPEGEAAPMRLDADIHEAHHV
jgi:hypothetical protein